MKSKTVLFQLCILSASLLLISCGVEQTQPPIQTDNIRVIELDPEPVNVNQAELNALTNELSRYDCDLNWILFDYDSYELNLDGKVELRKVANILRENNEFKARIRAFTDNKGSTEYNKKLSGRRALIAKQYLLSLGVPKEKISISAYADSNPIAKNTEDDAGRKYNRRIELFLLDNLNNTVCRSHAPKVPINLKAK